MAILDNLINIGNVVNDGLGDDLRTAFRKVNENFTELNSQLTPTIVVTGTTGASIFKGKTGSTFEFKSLVAGDGIKIDDTVGDDYLVIRNEATNRFTGIGTDAGAVSAAVYPQITMEGAAAPNSISGIKDIEVTAFGSTISFKTVLPVTDILTTYDFGPISGEYATTTQLSLAAANIDFGTVDLPGGINLDCGGIV